MTKQTQTAVAILVVGLVGLGVFAYTRKDIAVAPTQPVGQACTMEAKLCPDGSYVGRSGPNCEFAACPNATAASSTPSTPPVPTSPVASSTAWEKDLRIVTQAQQNSTVMLTKNERFIIKFGSTLKWTFAFDPAGSITRVPNSTTADGIQGIYEADKVGNASLLATGAPICKPMEACPQFLQKVVINFSIK